MPDEWLAVRPDHGFRYDRKMDTVRLEIAYRMAREGLTVSLENGVHYGSKPLLSPLDTAGEWLSVLLELAYGTARIGL